MTGWDLPQGALHPDVAFDGRDPVVAYQLGAEVIVATRDTRAVYPCSGLAFPRLASVAGRLWLAYRDPQDRGRIASAGLSVDLGPAWGNDPLCLGGGSVYCQSSSTVTRRALLADGIGPPETLALIPAPTGLSHVDSTGRLVTVDQARRSVAGMTRPSFAGGYVVGEGPESGAILQSLDGTRRITLWPGAVSMTPRLAWSSGHMLVAKWQPGRVMRLTEAEVITVAPVPVPVPTPTPPVPIPTPQPPEPEPVLIPKRLSAAQQEIVDALYARHTDLARGNDDQRRTLMEMIAQTWHARLGKRFGWKSNHGIGIANSKDGGAEIPEGNEFTPNQRQTLYLWDLFNGTTREPHRFPFSEEHNQEQFFVPVEPIDHLADQPVPVPVPPAPVPVPSPPTPVPLPPMPPTCEFAPCDHAQLNDRLDRIEAALLALVVQTARPRPVTLQARYLGTLTGEVGAPKL